MLSSRHRLWIDPAHLQLLRDHGLDDVTALLRAKPAADLNKPGLAAWRQRIRLELAAATGGAQRLYVKRFLRPPWHVHCRLRLAGFRNCAEQERHWLRRVAELGISVPRPVACGSVGGWLFDRESCLVLAEVPGCALQRWPGLRPSGMPRPARHALMLQLADLVRRLHGAGLFHRDLYLAHIFIEPDADGPPQLFLIDLQRVVAPRWRRWRWMVKDLAALNFSSAQAGVSGAERLRWLRRYLGVRRLRAEDRRLVRAVAAKSARMARHSARHGM
jgi:hypothetical protein